MASMFERALKGMGQSFLTLVGSIPLLTGPLYYSGTQVGLQPPARPGTQSSGYTGSTLGIVFSRVYAPLPSLLWSRL